MMRSRRQPAFFMTGILWAAASDVKNRSRRFFMTGVLPVTLVGRRKRR